MIPSITVTMSTYNVEAYITESLASIFGQSFEDFEFICIDDSSTDGTQNILKIWASKYPNMKLVTKARNEGLSVARNEAINLARGKYICFVDGDDVIDMDLLQKAFTLAEESDSDMVIWDYLPFWEGIGIEQHSFNQISSRLLSDKRSLLRQKSFIWNKLIRIDRVKDLGIVFPSGRTKQDIPVHWKLIVNTDKIAVIPEKLYYYRLRPGATSFRTDASLLDIIFVMNIVKEDLRYYDKFEEYREIYNEQRLELFYHIIRNIDLEHLSIACSMIRSNVDDEPLDDAIKSHFNIAVQLFYIGIKVIMPTKWIFGLVFLTRRILFIIKK